MKGDDRTMEPKEYINVRSDTLTLPTPDMLEAACTAQLGDDNRREDPTVRELESLAASLLGKEAALLTTSGHMSNLIAGLVHAKRGDEVIMEETSHAFTSEQGSIAFLGGLIYRLVRGELGYPSPQEIEKAIRPANDIHTPRTGLVWLENTHNNAGGTVITPDQTRAVCDLAHGHGIPVHLDGARVFNAAVALGVDPKVLVTDVDSVGFCLSKGLSCPVGSVLAGREGFVAEARRVRKLIGGGMRQAGIIAAPGIVALKTMIPRLKEDHERTRLLAVRLLKIDGLLIDMRTVQTNMIRVDVSPLKVTAAAFASRLIDKGVEVLVAGPAVLRIVIHRHVEDRHVPLIAEAFGTVAREIHTK